jgi:hypothetical protein
VEFLGRADGQVKVRGHRIELGEVEAALRSHEAVQDAAVAPQQDRTGDLRLTAYVQPQRDAPPPPPAALRAHLQARLPEPMIPAAFVIVANLPLNPSGKLDRQALSNAGTVLPHDGTPWNHLPPRNPIEVALVNISADVLEISQLGVNDDFFALGGHSLLVTRLCSRIRRELGVELPVAVVFDHPTVAGLAEWVALAMPSSAAPAEDVITPVNRDEYAELDEAFADIDGLSEALMDTLVTEMRGKEEA